MSDWPKELSHARRKWVKMEVKTILYNYQPMSLELMHNYICDTNRTDLPRGWLKFTCGIHYAAFRAALHDLKAKAVYRLPLYEEEE